MNNEILDQYNDTFIRRLEEQLNDENAIKHAEEISGSAKLMLTFGFLKAMSRIVNAQKAQAAFCTRFEKLLDDVQPMIDLAKRELAKKGEEDRNTRYGKWVAKAGQKFKVEQSLGPSMPNIHVGSTIEIKYIDCFGDKEKYSHDPKIVFEQGVTLEEWVLQNMIDHGVLVYVEE